MFLYHCSCSPRAAKGSSHPSKAPAAELLKPCSKTEDLYPDVFEMLYCLGPQIYLDPTLLAKVLPECSNSKLWGHATVVYFLVAK